MFDVEVILRAVKAGRTIREFPVEWSCDPDTRLKLVTEGFIVLGELAQLRRTVG